MTFHALRGLGDNPAAVNTAIDYATAPLTGGVTLIGNAIGSWWNNSGSSAPGSSDGSAPSGNQAPAEPDCTPGTAGCVPHWYCYIPFMATPDCLASFQEGTSELSSAATQAATGTLSAFAGGLVSGAGEGLKNNASQFPFGTTLLLIGGGLAVVLLLTSGKRR